MYKAYHKGKCVGVRMPAHGKIKGTLKSPYELYPQIFSSYEVDILLLNSSMHNYQNLSLGVNWTNK